VKEVEVMQRSQRSDEDLKKTEQVRRAAGTNQ
jgi:hypothetical protein